MMHPELERRAYLDAMGIDVWLPRAEADSTIDSVAQDVSAVSELPGWDELRDRVANCTRCELSASRKQTVFGVGNRDASWMIVGEAPGAEEDRRGEPFVGRAGLLLDEMLRATGLDRDAVFIANILKCRPPHNRDPRLEEAAACRPYLARQIALVQPDIILAVGKIAAQYLLDSNDTVARMRGHVHDLDGTPLVVTYHPAYLLRSPSHKRQAWADLCLAKRVVAGGVA